MVAFLAARRIPVLACDEHLAPEEQSALAALPGVTLSSSRLPASLLVNAGTIVLSPGVPRTHPSVAAALANGVPVINDIEWLHTMIRQNERHATVIGITGSNGKSTVTTLIGQMVAAGSGSKVAVGGNLGQAAMTLWDPEVSAYVLELSSFQLESISNFRADVAVLLNVTPDHLDRYPDFADYQAAKERIFANQRSTDQAVLNLDDPRVADLALRLDADSGPRQIRCSLRQTVEGGVYVQGHDLIDHRGPAPRRVMDLTTLKITGPHNRANAVAAAAAAMAVGIPEAAIVQTLQQFGGLPHRCEWIRTLEGVDYYNDSKGTNPGAVVQSLLAFPGGVILIAGGRDKHGDYEPLIAPIRERVLGVVLIGEAAAVMAPLFAGHTRVVPAASMSEAVQMARHLAKPGGTVLLSPACASFDMFRDFEDRGDQFREAVHAL